MKLLFKMSFAKMRKTIGRFLSVLFIVALGVGFFAGLRETTPDILTTLDSYYDRTHLMDFKVVSTMGLTESDIESLKVLVNVETVIPSYSTDRLIDGDAIRIHALEEEINQVELKEGRLPEGKGECLADATKYQVGDKIHIPQQSEGEILDTFDYTVVGTVHSPLYIGKEKGIAQVGNGKLESFLFLPKENFHSEVYTEVYITAKDAQSATAYQKDYQEKTSLLEEELISLKPIRETIRYEEILEEATKEIRKIENEYQKEKEKAEKELADAKQTLDESKQELDSARRKLQQAKTELATKEQQGREQLQAARREWESGYRAYQEALATYQITEDQIASQVELLAQEIEKLSNLLATMSPDDPNYAVYQATLAQLQQQRSQLTALIETKEQLESTNQTITAQEQALEEQITSAKATITKSESEIASGEQKWQEGYQEYEEGVALLSEKTTEAEEKISLAKEELNNIEKPVWYLLDRTDNNGYISIWEDAEKVDSIAQVFPIFFILVVALMCFNTMNRMVEEERGEIGTLSSLGYSNFNIMSGYLFYVFFATVIGVTIGLLVGYTAIPTIIYQIYNANYILPELIITIKVIPFLLLVGCSLILMFLITILSCRKELKGSPASLLRPKAPKAGKKVFFEKITFLWKRLSFTGKVTARNMFRYKKRIIMTVLGIAGSSALLLTGFGLQDSINQLVDLQYENIIHYDALFVFQDPFQTIPSDWESSFEEDHIEEKMPIYQESFTFEAKDISHDVYLMVLSNPENSDQFLSLRSKINEENTNFPRDGVVITEKMAQLLQAEVGDFIKIRNSQNELFLLPVADVVENYTLHYIYLSPESYEKIFEKPVSYNSMMANLEEGTDKEALSTKWMNTKLVSTINYTDDNIEIFDTMISGLNKIVYLIIGASCMLAFIVLYNLTTINITERIREISTLKVLGFYDREVSSYVYRETLLLTILGIAVGLVLGISLHAYVLNVAETDNILFLRSIDWSSYLFSFLITILFGALVQLFTHFRLKKIDMIESLKSVE